jgi:UDP-N-acetylmuramyl pentapeptide phosphotransferase/UDP-N-acetylglucosamine-1-phosphate transferase
MLPAFLAALFTSMVLSLWIIRFGRLVSLCPDGPGDGPQRVHETPASRLGGIGLAGGFAAGVAVWAWQQPGAREASLLLMLCAAPALLAGLLEDVTGRTRPAVRLLMATSGGTLGIVLLGALIVRTDIPGLDQLVAVPLGAVAVTLFTVAGVTNSINIIDGLHGLASMCIALMMVGLAYVAFAVGDRFVAFHAIVVLAAVLGFFVWNFPRGLVFLGDGGAYFLGFMLSELGIVLVIRNPDVSPLFPLLLAVYPICETLFSMYRRRIVRGRPVSMPDGIHLHTLVYRRLIRWALGPGDAAGATRRNAAASPYLWILCSLSVAPAMLWWDESAMLALCLGLFVVSYVAIYRSIVRFRTPVILTGRRTPEGVSPAGRGTTRR